ncbi:hypothetical protein [Oscillatoria sp. FACHB-1406]|uniref:hypothetical protein n=1 Tax=Oscillatoria sp. FACHB-1406 TaxID=2692846 RepID=UPI001686B850|nr:hypothetical protein [Oscillatoria sp. FACHB-1406]MBD2580194.1 hypothetical protein [Oscillatoria sp. FACHB-1406]
MDDWSKGVLDWLETMTVEVEQFFQEIGDEMEVTVARAYQSISDNVDQFLDELEDFFEPIIVVYGEWDAIADDFESPLGRKVEPTLEQNAACIGCQHYHGYIHGGNLLVCGMHPYGWESSQCPDWEGIES